MSQAVWDAIGKPLPIISAHKYSMDELLIFQVVGMNEELDANWIELSAATRNVVSFLLSSARFGKEKAAVDAELVTAAVADAREVSDVGFERGSLVYWGMSPQVRSSAATSSSNLRTTAGAWDSGEECAPAAVTAERPAISEMVAVIGRTPARQAQ
jgi:hypothetical protein